MPTGDRASEPLVDTSVAVPVVLADHDQHEPTVRALGGRRLGLAGHAAFEAFSVLTRLPAPARRTPTDVARLLAVSFPLSAFLSSDATGALLDRLADLDIAGGSVYDALIGATAAEHQRVLVTRDRRALETYRSLGAEVELIA